MTLTSPTPARRSADPRIVRSEAAIREAVLVRLQAGRSFESLTVSEIADAAGVTRKTFYARFGALERVVFRIVAELSQGIIDDLDDEMLRLPRSMDSAAAKVFRAYATHQDVLGPVVERCPTGLVLEAVTHVADRMLDRVVAVNGLAKLDDARRDYLVTVVASMVHGVLSVWVRRGFTEPPEVLAALTDALLAEGIERILLGSSASE